MRRIRVSDIEALFERDQPGAGRAAAERLVQAIKDNRGKRVYEIEVSLIYTFTDRANAKSEKEARKYLEGVARDQFRVIDRLADKDAYYGWTEVRSRKAPGRLGMDATNENADWLRNMPESDRVRGKEVPTEVQTAKGPGSAPRPKRKPRPERD